MLQGKRQLVYLQLNKLKGLSCRIQSDLKKKEFELTLDLQAPVVQLSPELWNFEDFLDHVSQLQEKHKMYPSCRRAQAEESLERSPQLGKRIDKIVPKVVLEPEFWSVLAATF